MRSRAELKEICSNATRGTWKIAIYDPNSQVDKARACGPVTSKVQALNDALFMSSASECMLELLEENECMARALHGVRNELTRFSLTIMEVLDKHIVGIPTEDIATEIVSRIVKRVDCANNDK